jgi:hypothetical protein
MGVIVRKVWRGVDKYFRHARRRPGIHVFASDKAGVDGRDKPGHDEKKNVTPAKAGVHDEARQFAELLNGFRPSPE